MAVVRNVVRKLLRGFSLWKQCHRIPTLSWILIACWWLLLFSWKWMVENIFQVLQNTVFIFCFCLCFSVFTSSSSFILCLPYSLKPAFHYQVEDVSKGILIFLPVDCMGWKTLEAPLLFFWSLLHLQFLFMACHYLLQPFIPSLSLSFSLSIDLIL